MHDSMLDNLPYYVKNTPKNKIEEWLKHIKEVNLYFLIFLKSIWKFIRFFLKERSVFHKENDRRGHQQQPIRDMYLLQSSDLSIKSF
jgi:hypothetical protein